mmetsp:Transcript_12016/g.50308  ORF Transcript_12016/g.50308 Transcript_12016/m.50308 type:complete len:369 (+) Transcript_12016:189-1295(+)
MVALSSLTSSAASLTPAKPSIQRKSNAPTFDSFITARSLRPFRHLCTPSHALGSRASTFMGSSALSESLYVSTICLRVSAHVSNSNFLWPVIHKPAFTTRHVALGARGNERSSASASSSTTSMSGFTASNRFCFRARFFSAAARSFCAERILNSVAATNCSSVGSAPSSGSGGASSSGSGSAASSSPSLASSPSSGASAAASVSAIFACSSAAASRRSRRAAAAASMATPAAFATARMRSLSASAIARPLPPCGVFTVSAHSMPATSPVASTMGTAKYAPARGNPPTKCTLVGSEGASGSAGSSPSFGSRGGPRYVMAFGTSIQGAFGEASTIAKETPVPRSSFLPTSQSWSSPFAAATETYRKNMSS